MGKQSKLVEFSSNKTFSNSCLRDYLAKSKTSHVTIMYTYSHANTPLSQSEHAYYFSYYIKYNIDHDTRAFIQYMIKYITVCGDYNQKSYSKAVAMIHLKGPSTGKSQAFVHSLEEHKKHTKQGITTQGLKCRTRSIKQTLKKIEFHFPSLKQHTTCFS